MWHEPIYLFHYLQCIVFIAYSHMRIRRIAVSAMSDLYLVKNTSPSMSNTVPAFLTKLWTLVENSMVDDLICWDEVKSSYTSHFCLQWGFTLLFIKGGDLDFFHMCLFIAISFDLSSMTIALTCIFIVQQH